MALPDPIVSSSKDVMSGAVVFAGTRVPVQTLMDYLEEDGSLNEFLDDFPTVTREHAIAVLPPTATPGARADAARRQAR
jgi:uncharacterized protein (DUF433 family)